MEMHIPCMRYTIWSMIVQEWHAVAENPVIFSFKFDCLEEKLVSEGEKH